AGNSDPPPVLTHNNPVALQENAIVTTDSQGEARVEILGQNCSTFLYVFQNGNLKRSACRKSASSSGSAVCSLDSVVDVINHCTSQIDIQTPSTSAKSGGTWFTVIYLPEDQITIVQVLEGTVNAQAVIDVGTGEMDPNPQPVAAGLWFTRPGPDAPVINGIEGRRVLPLDVWPVLRMGLIDRYPMLYVWMRSVSQVPGIDGVAFPDILIPRAGAVNTRFIGQLWVDDRIQRAIIIGINWNEIIQQNWGMFDVSANLQIRDTAVLITRDTEFNREAALQLLSEAQFWQRAPTIVIAANEEDKAAVQFAYAVQTALLDLDVQTELRFVSPAQFKEMQTIDPNVDSPFILVSTSGEAFGRN
ncbi:MAG: hypothetical protein AAGU05_15375, partial [Anaerolineaceae bacterium]